MLRHIVEELGWMFNGTWLGRKLWSIEERMIEHEGAFWKGKKK